MYRFKLILLGIGIVAGYGAGFASLRWHARHHFADESGCHHRNHQSAPPASSLGP